MTYLRDETNPTAVPQRVLQGVITTDAVDMTDTISVVVPGLTEECGGKIVVGTQRQHHASTNGR